MIDGPESLGELLALQARKLGAQPALRARSIEAGWTTVTYAELDALASRLAYGLMEQGVEPGTPVAFLFSNEAGVEAVTTYCAIHRAGGVAIPINARFVGAEIAAMLDHSRVRVVLYESAFAQVIGDAAARVAGEVALIVAGEVSGREVSWRRAIAADPPAGALPQPGVADMADWLYTSGTTGRPKCAMLTHGNCLAASTSLAECFHLTQGDVHVTASPFYTSSGCHTSLLSSLAAGATYVMSPSTRAEDLLSLIVDEGATVVGAVPSIFAYIANSPRLDPSVLGGVKLVYHGGSAVSAGLVREIRAAFPEAEVINVYGQTESGNPGTVLPGEWSVAKAGSIGCGGMPGVDVRVVAEDGALVEADGIGEICLRSAAVMQGYLNEPEETARTLRDGWLHTGDLVRVDADGFMYIYDRIKDVIIRGGHNIASIEVESVINDHPRVLESAVVAKPHERLGEDLKAYVVLNGSGPCTAEELREFCDGRLADYKVPRDFSFVDELPRNPTGKVLKRELRGRALEESTRVSHGAP